MFCINCSHSNTNVTNSRPSKKTTLIWRRRQCPNCHQIFTTYERPSLADNRRITRPDGTEDIFNLGKLIQSIAASFSHNQRSAQYDSMALAQTVESLLLTSLSDPLTPLLISQTVHQTLQRFDQLAAIQYAAKHQLVTSIRRPGRPSITSRIVSS